MRPNILGRGRPDETDISADVADHIIAGRRKLLMEFVVMQSGMTFRSRVFARILINISLQQCRVYLHADRG